MPLSSYLHGPRTRLGLIAALIATALDQASKYYLLAVYDLGARGQVTVAPFVDFLLTRNTGISYGLFPQNGPFGQWLLVGLKAAAVLALWVWLARSSTRLTALGLGLIIGGAIGNGIDRLAYGWVVDFVLFHIETTQWCFNWYVFNLADVAIVAGVAGLLYESTIGSHAANRP